MMERNSFLAAGVALLLGGNLWADTTPAPSATALDAKLQKQKEARSQWAIEPHRPNYVLPLSYITSPNEDLAEDITGGEGKLQEVEIKFQISFRLALVQDMIKGNGDLYVAYTQVSVWQAYNRDISSPFRDTNYEPEFFVAFDTDYNLLGLAGKNVAFGAVHQSNGRGAAELSRSWNRLYANVALARGNFACSIKPWWRIPESEEEDNNPGIENYLGYGEFRAAYKWKEHVFATMLRNNLKPDDNRGAIELDWSFPLYHELKGYVQFFNGYGETLISYNERDQRIGIGFLLADWL